VKRLGVVIAAFLLVPYCRSSGQSIEYVSSTLWTGIGDIHVIDDYAYCAFYNGLGILDISNPSEPELISKCFLEGSGLDIQIVGDYAYIADYGACLQIVNISDPLSPFLEGSYEERSAEMISISGDNAFIVYSMASPWGGDYGLLIIDISDPTYPHETGYIQVHGGAYNLCAVGDYAYVSDNNPGFRIFDVSDPTDPDTIGTFQTPYFPWKIVVDGDYAYVADGHSGLTILDISDPANPQLINSFFENVDFRDIYVLDQRAYVLDEDIAPYGGVHIVNISDLLDPFIEGNYPIRGPERINVYGDYSYVLDAYDDLHIIDISDPYSPAYNGCYDTHRSVRDVFVDDRYAFVTVSHPYIFVIDVADPANPVYAGVSDTVGWSRDIHIVGDYAYLTGTDLQILDISNPSHPVSVGVYYTERDSRRVFVSNGFAYVTEYYGYNYDLEIVDVSDPANPYFVGGFDTLGSAGAICVAGDYAYVGVGYMGVIILDISDPSNPYAVGHFLEGQAAPGDIVIAGNLLYLTARDLQIFDISDPTSPTLIGSNDTPTVAGDVYVSQDYAYVVDRLHEGLWIFDIQNPENPMLAASYRRLGTFRNVFVSGDYIYVAEGSSLFILRFDSQTGIIEEVSEIPNQFSLLQNHPNPFNANTTISYDLPTGEDMTLEIYDILGRKIETLVDGWRPAGAHSVVWDTEDVSSGVYFYRIQAGEYVQSKSCLLLR
jgi:hypothetical protein